MDSVFHSHRVYVGTFFDDVIEFSKIEEEHWQHLAKVFKKFWKHNLVINGKKSNFFMEEIHYLGHLISKNGVRMDPNKLKPPEWSELTSVHEVCGFYGPLRLLSTVHQAFFTYCFTIT